MINLDTIQQDIASLPLDAQEVILELVCVLKKSYFPNQPEIPESKTQDWSDFIGCIEAEPDLSRNYKTYLSSELEEKFGTDRTQIKKNWVQVEILNRLE